MGLPMRLEAKAALALGILLPALETCRLGLGGAGLDFTSKLPDYFAGALLLVGAWAAHRHRSWAVPFLVAAWSWVTGLFANSTFDQALDTFRSTEAERYNAIVLTVKFLLCGTSALALALAFRSALRGLNSRKHS